MRRASAELAEKRRASLRGYDGTLDPYHAAILFRDSRGVSKIHYFYMNDVHYDLSLRWLRIGLNYQFITTIYHSNTRSPITR